MEQHIVGAVLVWTPHCRCCVGVEQHIVGAVLVWSSTLSVLCWCGAAHCRCCVGVEQRLRRLTEEPLLQSLLQGCLEPVRRLIIQSVLSPVPGGGRHQLSGPNVIHTAVVHIDVVHNLVVHIDVVHIDVVHMDVVQTDVILMWFGTQDQQLSSVLVPL